MIRWLSQIPFTRFRPLEAAAAWAAKRIVREMEKAQEQTDRGE